MRQVEVELGQAFLVRRDVQLGATVLAVARKTRSRGSSPERFAKDRAQSRARHRELVPLLSAYESIGPLAARRRSARGRSPLVIVQIDAPDDELRREVLLGHESILVSRVGSWSKKSRTLLSSRLRCLRSEYAPRGPPVIRLAREQTRLDLSSTQFPTRDTGVPGQKLVKEISDAFVL